MYCRWTSALSLRLLRGLFIDLRHQQLNRRDLVKDIPGKKWCNNMIISLYSSFAVVQFVNFALVASGGRWKNTIMKFPNFEQRRKRSAILQLSITWNTLQVWRSKLQPEIPKRVVGECDFVVAINRRLGKCRPNGQSERLAQFMRSNYPRLCGDSYWLILSSLLQNSIIQRQNALYSPFHPVSMKP